MMKMIGKFFGSVFGFIAEMFVHGTRKASADGYRDKSDNVASHTNTEIHDVYGNKAEPWTHVMDEGPFGPYPHLDPHRDIYMAWDDD